MCVSAGCQFARDIINARLIHTQCDSNGGLFVQLASVVRNYPTSFRLSHFPSKMSSQVVSGVAVQCHQRKKPMCSMDVAMLMNESPQKCTFLVIFESIY